MTPRVRKFRFTLFATAAALALAACGEVLQLAEIEGSGYSDGSASGYGSVYVNGTRFATDGATIRVDGQDATEDDLRIGMQLQVDGDILAGVAQSIVFDRDLRGPVDAIERDNPAQSDAVLTVLGQTVVVNSMTRFLGTSLDALDTNDLVDVSGLRIDDDRLLATLVRLRDALYTPASASVDLEGRIDAINASVARVGGVDVDLSGTPLAGIVAPGDRIEAAGLQATRGGLVVADTARLDTGRDRDGPRAQLEGIIQAIDGTRITVAQAAVETAGAQRDDGLAAPLAIGQRVIVRGTQSGETIDADRITVVPDAPLLLLGQITANDVQRGTLTLLDQQVTLRDDTQFIDASDAQVRRFRNDDLAAGDAVEILGHLDASGGVVANRLTRVNPVASATIRGTASNINAAARQLDVLGVRISTDSSTRFQAPDGTQESALVFFSNIDETSTVTATGPLTGTATMDASRLMRQQ